MCASLWTSGTGYATWGDPPGQQVSAKVSPHWLTLPWVTGVQEGGMEALRSWRRVSGRQAYRLLGFERKALPSYSTCFRSLTPVLVSLEQFLAACILHHVPSW